MKKQVNFAIVGCGRIAPFHANGIKAAPSANLVAVCDIIEEKAKDFANEYGVEKWYTDAETMFNNEEIEVCCVCVPSGYHHDIAIAAANHGINVLSEKPLDVTKENMQAIRPTYLFLY